MWRSSIAGPSAWWNLPTAPRSDLLPVDGDGVCLPGEDFSQKQKESYPCLAGIDHRPIQPVGHPWGDARVVDGASIAAALLPVWQQLKLYRIQAAATAPSPGAGPRYELYTARARGLLGAAQGQSPTRASHPRRKRWPGSCGMRRPMEVSTPDRRWISPRSHRPEPRSNEQTRGIAETEWYPFYEGLLALGVALRSGGGAAGNLVGGRKFFAENGKVIGSFDADPNNSRRNANDRDGDLIPNQDFFPRFSR